LPSHNTYFFGNLSYHSCLFSGSRFFIPSLFPVMEMADRAPLRHLVWTLSKDDIQQILAHIERFKTRLILALQKDNMKLSRAIKTDTAAIEPIGKRVETISNNLDSLSTGMCAQSSSTFLEKVLLWLSPVEFQKHHDSAREDRVEGTGQWFLSSPEFIFWRDNAEKTLFCPVCHLIGSNLLPTSPHFDY